MKTKSEIRKHIRSLRLNLSIDAQDIAAKQCCEIILSNKLTNPKNYSHIAFYISHDNELNLEYILKYCLENHIKAYLPVLNNKKLDFVEFNHHTKFKNNIYNIPEPIASNKNSYIDPKHLDLIFVPLVAFTKSGARLGMGGGYYDRTFAFLANSNNNINNDIGKPILIGVAYDVQCIENLPIDSWDINLHGIVTESSLINIVDN